MTDKHTPGRWAATNGKYGWQIHSVPSEKNKSSHWIANIKCESCPAHEEANARLIAAAPDLLATLEALDAFWLATLPNGPPADGEPHWLAPETIKIWRDARAAIGKAKGTV